MKILPFTHRNSIKKLIEDGELKAIIKRGKKQNRYYFTDEHLREFAEKVRAGTLEKLSTS